MSRQVNLGQIVPNITIGSTTTGNPGTQAIVTNVGTSLNPILNFTIPKGDAGAIKMLIVAELPATGADDTIYLVPITPDTTGNNYAEYVYINGAWELLGKIGVSVDLTDYYTKTETNNLLSNKVGFTDFPNGQVAGVIKIYEPYAIRNVNNGIIGAMGLSYETYTSASGYSFVGKTTLENVITGKGLVSNTDYASDSVGGVIKTNWGSGTYMSNGALVSRVADYNVYQQLGSSAFIGKGTLENVLSARYVKVVVLTESEYNALTEYEDNTEYHIIEG